MKTTYFKTVLLSVTLFSVVSCKKGESSENSVQNYSATADSSVIVSDSISSAATTLVKDKQFIKTADVNMEVKEVYDATISIEKSLKSLGGFVTSSNLNTQIISEETYNTSDEKAMLVRKFQTENKMQVRVPTENLGEFLTSINDKQLFLHSRNITAEDVTSNMKMAEMEAKRNIKTGENIATIKTGKEKVKLSDINMSEGNDQKIASFETADQIKYSTVDIYLKEPKLRVAEIAVINTKNIDNKFKSSFFYDLKNALAEGCYLIQKKLCEFSIVEPSFKDVVYSGEKSIKNFFNYENKLLGCTGRGVRW